MCLQHLEHAQKFIYLLQSLCDRRHNPGRFQHPFFFFFLPFAIYLPIHSPAPRTAALLGASSRDPAGGLPAAGLSSPASQPGPRARCLRQRQRNGGLAAGTGLRMKAQGAEEEEEEEEQTSKGALIAIFPMAAG